MAVPGPHPRILTIGHSNHSLERFFELLQAHGVTAVADVRSRPYSARLRQFNRESLAGALLERGIRYTFFGKELGGRPEDLSCYENGKLRYDRLAETAVFQSGLERALRGAEGDRLALMCAEKEPLACHRAL